MNKLDVLEIVGGNAYYIKNSEFVSYGDYYINGEIIDNNFKKRKETILLKTDKIQYKSKSKIIVDYRRGKEVMTKEEYESKPQRYYEDTKEDDILRAIANKKELSGFEPNCKEPDFVSVNLKIIGMIEDTGSKFISCLISNSKWSKRPVVYTVYGNRIAMNEYEKLKNKYSDHADFGKPDRSYLRFVNINGNYSFGNCYPFSDNSYVSDHLRLSEAKEKEKDIRECVRGAVVRAVFKKDFTKHKKNQIINQLKSIRKLKTKKATNEMLTVLIEYLFEYFEHC